MDRCWSDRLYIEWSISFYQNMLQSQGSYRLSYSKWQNASHYLLQQEKLRWWNQLYRWVGDYCMCCNSRTFVCSKKNKHFLYRLTIVLKQVHTKMFLPVFSWCATFTCTDISCLSKPNVWIFCKWNIGFFKWANKTTICYHTEYPEYFVAEHLVFLIQTPTCNKMHAFNTVRV